MGLQDNPQRYDGLQQHNGIIAHTHTYLVIIALAQIMDITREGQQQRKGQCDRGIFVDGVGYGSALIANKISGCYAAVCQDPLCATLARQHTDSNILCLGAKIIGTLISMEIVKTWLGTDALTDAKYRRRVQKVCDINDKHCVPLDQIKD